MVSELATNETLPEVEDFFVTILDNSVSKAFMVSTWVLVQFLGTPALMGIVRFKNYGSLNYQTLIDKLNAYFYSLLLLHNLTGFNLVLFRVFAPLPKLVCIVHLVAFYAMVIGLSLASLQIHLLRCLYLCVWKNVGVLNDDFCGTFFIILNTVTTAFLICIVVITKEYVCFELALCAGVRVETFYTWIFKSDGIQIIPICLGVSCFIALTLHAVTFYKTRRLGKAEQTNMFDMGRLAEVIMTIAVFMALAPGLYVRWLYTTGRLTSVGPIMLCLNICQPYLTIFLVWPLFLYYQNANLRRHFLKCINVRINLFRSRV